MRFGGGDIQDANADARILLAGFWITLKDDAFMDRLEIDKSAFRDAGLVRLQIGDGMGIGRPPVTDVAAAENFFPVDPGESAIEEFVGAVGSEAGFLFCGDIKQVEIVGANKGKIMAVGGKLDVFFCGGGVGDTEECGRRKIEKENVSVKKEDGLLACSVESVRPGKSLLNLRGRVDGDERGNGLVHVEDGVALASCRIKALIGALGFRLANVVEDCGVVCEPGELRQFGEAFAQHR